MKGVLAFCLIAYFIAEATAKPSPQILDGATDFFDRVKVRIQESLDQAREAATRAMETMQSGFHSVQQVAQSKLEPDNKQSHNETEVVDQDGKAE